MNKPQSNEYESIIREATTNDSIAKEATARIVGRGLGTNTSSTNLEAGANLTQDERNELQETIIEAYARAKGIWMNNTNSTLSHLYGEPINSGEDNQESNVYLKDERTVIKSKNTYQYRDLLEAILSIGIHNYLFPESTLTLVGFGRNSEHNFVLLLEQPYVVAHAFLTQEEIDQFIQAEFPSLKKDTAIPLRGRYTDGIIHLNDLHEANAVRDSNGDIWVLDSITHFTNHLIHCDTSPK